jgi:hypothetical protein
MVLMSRIIFCYGMVLMVVQNHCNQAFPLQYSHVFPNAWEYVYSQMYSHVPVYCIPVYTQNGFPPTYQVYIDLKNLGIHGQTREYTREYCIPTTALGIHVFPCIPKCIPNVFPVRERPDCNLMVVLTLVKIGFHLFFVFFLILINKQR